MDFPPK